MEVLSATAPAFNMPSNMYRPAMHGAASAMNGAAYVRKAVHQAAMYASPYAAPTQAARAPPPPPPSPPRREPPTYENWLSHAASIALANPLQMGADTVFA